MSKTKNSIQHEITESHNLLDSDGNIAEPGWAKKLLPIYNRNQIKAKKFRIKEWDYYFISDGKIGIALTIADNGYMGLDSISYLDFTKPYEITKSPMRLFPMGNTNLPNTSTIGDVSVKEKNYEISFFNDGSKRELKFKMKNFDKNKSIDGHITLSKEPKESMVICTPFKKKGHFYYNQKINCLEAAGHVTLGEKTYNFNPENSFGTLDWGRGVWTYHNTWYWCSASGLANNTRFGWNLGYGFGDTSSATENVLFYNGKTYKLNNIKFHIPDGQGKPGSEKGLTDPWKITSDDGCFEMDFKPIIDRAACTDFKILKSDQHQVFGLFTGTAIIDKNKKINVKDFFGFAEKVENKW